MKPFILAITGPTGSGKTTTASELAEQIDRCVNIDADTVKHMIVTGFIYGDSGAGIPQWELLGTNIGMLAKNFQEAGFNVIINGYINERAWKNIQEHVALTHKVLLLPHVDTNIQRDAGRHADIKMGGETVKVHNDYFSNTSIYDDFTQLDSTEHSIEETVHIIKEMLENL
jgi:adenylylsulfate kinase-like enzyme